MVEMREGARRCLVLLSLTLLLAVLVGPAANALASPRPPAAPVHYSAGRGTTLAGPTALAGTTARKGPAWWSHGRGAGASVRWTSTRERRIDRLRITSSSTRRMADGTIRFSDGSAVRVTSARNGRVDVRIPPRTVRWAVLTIDRTAGRSGRVALTGWRVDASGPSRSAQVGRVRALKAPPKATTASAGGTRSTPAPGATAGSGSGSVQSSTGRATSGAIERSGALDTSSPSRTSGDSTSGSAEPGGDAAVSDASSPQGGALTDARDSLPGSTGLSWTAPEPGTQDLELRWPAPVRVSSLQIYGSPVGSGAIRSGSVSFPGGDAIRLLPVPANAAGPVTIGFSPRVLDRLTIRLVPDAGDVVRVRELAAYGPGELAPVRGTTDAARITAATDGCATTSAAATADLRLVCPSTGSRLSGTSRIVVSGPEGATVRASAMRADGTYAQIAAADVSGGVARLEVDAGVLPAGPVAILIASPEVARAMHAQFLNAGSPAGARAPEDLLGKSLVFDDEFDSPLSVSRTGAGAAYAATKPASWGNSEFGDAVFADPAHSPENISTLDGVLRIRASPLAAGEVDPNGWGRTTRSGIISSASVPGGGFAAQYGYYEARMLAPAAPGTWPAFWMMSSRFLENSESAPNSEVDAVELYGHDPTYACQSWINWIGVSNDQGSKIDCHRTEGDWALTWHTYGVDIGKDATRFYVDGVLTSTSPPVQNAVDPFYFMLDLSLGGGYPTDLSASSGIADLYVDWVRVYA